MSLFDVDERSKRTAMLPYFYTLHHQLSVPTKYQSIAVRFERSFTSTKSSRAVTIPKEQSYGVLRVRVRKIQISFSLDERARTKYVSVLRRTPTFGHL